MQKKWIIAALILIVCSFSSIWLYEDTEIDASSDTVTYYIQIGDGSDRTINIITNENYFKSVDEDCVVKWSYLDFTSEGGTNYSQFQVDQEVIASSNYKFLLEMGGDNGTYTLKIINTATSPVVSQLRLMCSITVQLKDSLNQTLEYETEELNIHVMMSLGSASVLPVVNSYMVSTDTSGLPVPKSSIVLEEGKPVTLTPVISNSSMAGTADKYNWYAVNLPTGLAMTSDGVIAGVPVKHSDFYANEITVYVEDKFGIGSSYTMHISVDISESRSDIKYYMCDGEFGTSTASGIVQAPVEYITQRDKVVSLVIEGKLNAETGEWSNPVGSIKVIDKVDSTLVRKEITPTEVVSGVFHYYVYTIPTEGTGFYTIKMYGSGNVLCNNIDLYVMSKLLAVESAIIVGSDSSS